MYRERGGGGGSSLDRKRINDALDKHLEKSSPSTSRGLNSSIKDKDKDKERFSMPSTSTVAGLAKSQHQLEQHRGDNRSSSTLITKNKCSEGLFLFTFLYICVCFCYAV